MTGSLASFCELDPDHLLVIALIPRRDLDPHLVPAAPRLPSPPAPPQAPPAPCSEFHCTIGRSWRM